jgi:hypothetical protein
MPSENDPGVCRAKKGLLFLQDCGEPAIARCERCSRPICGMHQVLTRTIVCCPECAAGMGQTEPAAAGPAANQPANPAVEAVRRRQVYYSGYGYHPYYYGHHVYYSDSDYHVFDEKSHVHHGPPGAEDASSGAGTGDAGGGAEFGSTDDADSGGGADFGSADDLDNAMES